MPKTAPEAPIWMVSRSCPWFHTEINPINVEPMIPLMK